MLRSHARSTGKQTQSSKTNTKSTIELKEQSTARESPKKSKSKSSKSKASSKPVPILHKLKECMEEIKDKLNRLNDFNKDTSIIESLGSGSTVSMGKIKSEFFFGDAEGGSESTTDALCEKMEQFGISNMKNIDGETVGLDELKGKCKVYEKVFNCALSRPHIISKIKIKENEKEIKCSCLLEEIKSYKSIQNNNYSYLNKQLLKYLKEEDKEVITNESITSLLRKQAKANYRWIQIQENMNEEDFKLLQRVESNEEQATKQQEQLKIENNREEEELSGREGAQIEKEMFLKNYNWEKYIWNDDVISSTSDLLCQSSEHSFNYSQINNDMEDETNQIQENVELILSWLLNEFVVELAEKLDFNTFIKNTTSSRELDSSYEKLLHKINQTAHDCNFIDTISSSTPISIPIFIAEALMETIKNNPSLNSQQAKDKLKYLICTRSIDPNELIPGEEIEEIEWIRLHVISELEECIWEGIVMEEVCKLWMG